MKRREKEIKNKNLFLILAVVLLEILLDYTPNFIHRFKFEFTWLTFIDFKVTRSSRGNDLNGVRT